MSAACCARPTSLPPARSGAKGSSWPQHSDRSRTLLFGKRSGCGDRHDRKSADAALRECIASRAGPGVAIYIGWYEPGIGDASPNDRGRMTGLLDISETGAHLVVLDCLVIARSAAHPRRHVLGTIIKNHPVPAAPRTGRNARTRPRRGRRPRYRAD